MPSTWNEQRLVESFDVDAGGRLKPQVLFAFLTNSAWKHAALSDVGYDGLSARNQLWVLNKLQLVIQRMPRWGDTLHIETWGKGTDRLYALRDYSVTFASGEALASASTAWLIIDKETRRPFRTDRLALPWVIDRSELSMDVKKVPEIPEARERARFRAAYSDLDPNNHVTAMKYLEWIMDSHPRDFLETHRVRSVEMSFLGEATIDDAVIVSSGEGAYSDVFALKRLEDKRELCRARIAWAQAHQEG